MKPFPFFRLSRELRDQIYAELDTESAEFNIALPRRTEPGKLDHRDNGVMTAGNAVNAKVTSLPATNLTLVSRQFKEEYESELRRHMCLKVGSFTDKKLKFEVLMEDSKASLCLRQIPMMEMRIWLPTPHPYYPELYDRAREVLLPHMPNLKSFTQDLLFKLPSRRFELNPDDRPLALRPATFADRSVVLAHGSNTIPLKTRVYLASTLVTINLNYRATPADVSEFLYLKDGLTPFIILCLQFSQMNQMLYRALPPKEGEGMVWGLDLVAEDGEKTWDWRQAMGSLQKHFD